MKIIIKIDKKGNAKVKVGNNKTVHLLSVSHGWDFTYVNQQSVHQMFRCDTIKKFYIEGRAK